MPEGEMKLNCVVLLLFLMILPFQSFCCAVEAKEYTGLSEQKLKKAADNGSRDAMTELGAMYYRGQGVAQNYEEAHRWYRKAAELGDTDAMYNLGLMYEYGLGVETDHSASYMWCSLAALGGEFEAVKVRDGTLKMMSSSQLREGQRLTKEWLETHPGFSKQ